MARGRGFSRSSRFVRLIWDTLQVLTGIDQSGMAVCTTWLAHSRRLEPAETYHAGPRRTIPGGRHLLWSRPGPRTVT